MKAKLLWMVVGLQLLWIGGVTVFQEHRLRAGTVVRLAAHPVDPRDLLRGDYVVLGYDAGHLPVGLFVAGAPPSTAKGLKVWVRLAETNGLHVARAASLEPLQGTAREPVLQGTIASVAADGSVSAEYGLERYYVREGTGNPRGVLTVDAVLSASGVGVIRQLYVDGVPYAQAMAAARR